LARAWLEAAGASHAGPASPWGSGFTQNNLAGLVRDDSAAAAIFLQTVATALLSEHMGELFTQEPAACWLSRAGAAMAAPSHTRERLAAENNACLVAIIQPVLAAGISLRDRTDDLWEIAEVGLSDELGDEEIAGRLIDEMSASPPIAVIVPPDLVPAIVDQIARYFQPLGIRPDIVTWAGDGGDVARVLLNDLLLNIFAIIPARHVFAKCRAIELPESVGEGQSWTTPDGREGSLVPEAKARELEEAGIEAQDRLAYAAAQIAGDVERNLWRLITGGIAETALAHLAEKHEHLALACARTLPLHELALLLQQLLRERLPLHDLSTICERIVTFDSVIADEWKLAVLDDRLPLDPTFQGLRNQALDRANMVRFVRLGLRRLITWIHARGAQSIPALRIDEKIELTLLSHLAACFDSGFGRLLSPELDEIRSRLVVALNRHALGLRMPILVTAGPVRQFIYDLISDEFPGISVLEPNELDARIAIQELARVA
jgi:type III secretory pathway component EscV